MKALLAAGCLALGLTAFANAQAYELTNVFKTEHFAINQVVLGPNETLDGVTQSAITNDVRQQNRLDRLYQSTTVVIKNGGLGFKGKINAPIEGVLTIANFGTGKDRILFNTNARTMSDAGLYVSFDQLIEMVNQKSFTPLLLELEKLPLIVTNVPVTKAGYDRYAKAFYVTAYDPAIIMDLRIDDSVGYKVNSKFELNDTCRINVLTFVNRMVDEIPVFISGRAALNSVTCKNPPAGLKQY